MSQDRLPPPEQEACLVRLRPSSQKGGTIVAEDVGDLPTHERRLCDPEGYRPRFCPRCGGTILHVHDYRERVLRAEPGKPTASIVRHECVGCAAIWQILPAFIARHLWRTWRVVEHTLRAGVPIPAEGAGRRWPPVAARTQRRWRERWQRPARFVAQVLASCGEAAWVAVATRLSQAATCAELVAAYAAATAAAAGHRLAVLAALIYRLQPKVRLI
jgi:Domain of unknown function (DUF6431)